MRPKRYCREPSCDREAEGASTRCQYHRTIRQEEWEQRQADLRRQREDAGLYELYRSRDWTLLRKFQLAAEPMCCVAGCGERATVADHIRPHHGSRELFFDPRNLQSMCKRHHDQKTAKHDGGFGNRRRLP